MNWFYQFISAIVAWLSTETTATYGVILLAMTVAFIAGTYGSALIRIKK